MPERPVTTAELVARVPGTWDAARVAARTGIAARHFVAPGTLHVQDGRLQHAAERQGLLRFALAAASPLLERLGQVPVEIHPELPQINTDGGEDLLALGIVCKREQQVLERQVRMTPRRGLTVCDGQNNL